VQHYLQAMLAASTEVRQIRKEVYVGLHHWATISPYQRMRTVEATFNYIEERREEYQHRRKMGLVRLFR